MLATLDDLEILTAWIFSDYCILVHLQCGCCTIARYPDNVVVAVCNLGEVVANRNRHRRPHVVGNKYSTINLNEEIKVCHFFTYVLQTYTKFEIAINVPCVRNNFTLLD